MNNNNNNNNITQNYFVNFEPIFDGSTALTAPRIFRAQSDGRGTVIPTTKLNATLFVRAYTTPRVKWRGVKAKSKLSRRQNQSCSFLHNTHHRMRGT